MTQSETARKKARIVIFCILAAITYGIIHDQITAHLCVEYFTVAHPSLFDIESPTALGICWGVLATVGVGFILGMILAEVAQSGDAPSYPASQLRRSVARLLVVMGAAATAAGLLGFELSRAGIVHLPTAFADNIDAERHARFLAVWFAHGASYLGGLAGAFLLISRIWRERGRPRILALIPTNRIALARLAILIALGAVVCYLRFSRS